MYNSPLAVLKGIRTEFSKIIAENTSTLFGPLVENIKSSGAYEDYRFLDSLPYIKEWTDNVDYKSYKDYLLTIRNKPWQFGINVNRFTLEDSKSTLGSLELEIRQAVNNWKDFQDNLVNKLIYANGTAYDGSSFFATSHNIDGADAIDNLHTGTGITLAQLETDLNAIMAKMYGYKDRNSIPLNRNPNFTVVIPSQLIRLFEILQGSSEIYVSGTKTNTLAGKFDIIVNSWQSTSDNDWFLVNTNAPIKPFIYQTREAPKWKVKDEEDQLDIKYFSVAQMNAGYGNFAAMAKVNN